MPRSRPSGRPDLSTDESAPALTAAGERLLAAAADLFYARGIHAVGVELIAEHAGTTKKTLYDCFGSKDALVARYLLRRASRWRQHLLGWLDREAAEPGRERVLAVFDALQHWHRGQERGCAFVNAYAEIGGTDHPGVPVIRADKQWMQDLFVSLARDADLVDPESTGRLLHLLYEGGLVVAAAGGRAEAIAEARLGAATLLSTLPVATRAPLAQARSPRS